MLMKRVLLSVFTIVALLHSVVVSAQTRLEAPSANVGFLEKSPSLSLLVPESQSKAHTPQQKIRVDAGEHIMGFYATDELPEIDWDGYLGFGTNASLPVANRYEGDVLSNFVGGDIMRFRFAVACDVYVSNAFIYSIDLNQGNLLSDEPIFQQDINETLSVGWHDVELTEPITIEEGYGFLIGFEYTQIYGEYPLVTDMELEQDYECNYFYYHNYYWMTNNNFGALCVQAVVKGGNFIENDIAVSNLSVKKYNPKDRAMDYSFRVRNVGDGVPSSYSIKVEVDGNEVETLEDPIELTSNFQTVSGTVDVSDMAVGLHTLRVSVDQIDGATPAENTDDDLLEATFCLYEGETAERQMHLVENFTSIYGQYCPLGDLVIKALQEDYPDKYAWVAMHSMGRGTDTLSIHPYSFLEVEYLLEVNSYPSVALSRAALTCEDLSLEGDYWAGVGYSSAYSHRVAKDLDDAIEDAYEDVPAFVSVDITQEYDADTRELTITVSGEGCENASSILADNRLTIYLTEDGIEGRQLCYDENTETSDYEDYIHNNVLRAIPTEYEWGDDINWTSESSYENTVTTTLDEKWDDGNMHVVAFISGPMKVWDGDAWEYGELASALVNNANCVALCNIPLGISAVTINPENKAQTYYTTDGRQLSAPMKGVNIVKCSDGTTKKILIK